MKKIKTLGLSIALLSILLISCTKKFDDINTDKKSSISQHTFEYDYNFIGGFFTQVQEMIYCNYNWGSGTDWPYQLMQNLNADIYSGFMMTPTPFAGNVNNTTYFMMDGWNFAAWDYTYGYLMSAALSIQDQVSSSFYPNFYGILLICKVEAMHRISDLYGPIIYTHYGESVTGGAYDSQKDAYYAFFNDLDTAINVLSRFVKDQPNNKQFVNFDQFFGGDYVKWIQWANSLKLRLAIRISNVDPVKAKAEGESAMANEYGLLTDVAAVKCINGYANPAATIANGWGDIRTNAVLTSILGGYNDPRLPAYVLAATDSAVAGQYIGIRQGINITAKDVYEGYSNLNITTTTPAILMTPAEVYFLRAEGALRGWTGMGGTVQELYEAGITASMTQWAVSIGGYLTSNAVGNDYVDPKNSANNISGLNKVSPKWDDSAPDSIKMQKIMTQKWIAIWPEGLEAWSEVRRTGYPQLFPVVINNSTSTNPVSTKDFVRRLNFSSSERNNNPDGYAKAVELLGGPDYSSTHLWWDVQNGK